MAQEYTTKEYVTKGYMTLCFNPLKPGVHYDLLVNTRHQMVNSD